MRRRVDDALHGGRGREQVSARSVIGASADGAGRATRRSPVGDPGFGFAPWAPGRADDARLETRYAGKNSQGMSYLCPCPPQGR